MHSPYLVRALATVAAVLIGCQPASPPIVEVVVAAQDLDPGTLLASDRLVSRAVPAAEAERLIRKEEAGAVVEKRVRFHLDSGTPLRVEYVGGDELKRPSDAIQKKSRVITVPLRGADTLRSGDRIDIVGHLNDPDGGEGVTMTLLQQIVVVAVRPSTLQEPGVHRVEVLVLPEEAEALQIASRLGLLHASRRAPDDVSLLDVCARETRAALLTGDRIDKLLARRRAIRSVGEEVRSPTWWKEAAAPAADDR